MEKAGALMVVMVVDMLLFHQVMVELLTNYQVTNLVKVKMLLELGIVMAMEAAEAAFMVATNLHQMMKMQTSEVEVLVI